MEFLARIRGFQGLKIHISDSGNGEAEQAGNIPTQQISGSILQHLRVQAELPG